MKALIASLLPSWYPVLSAPPQNYIKLIFIVISILLYIWVEYLYLDSLIFIYVQPFIIPHLELSLCKVNIGWIKLINIAPYPHLETAFALHIFPLQEGLHKYYMIRKRKTLLNNK